MDIPINYVAVLLAALGMMILGALWYSPILFGKPWMRLMGMSAMGDESKKGMMKSYALMFVGTLITSYVLAHFTYLVATTTYIDALVLGFWLWLGFMAPLMLGSVLWERRPWTLYLINASYQLAAILIAAVILTLLA